MSEKCEVEDVVCKLLDKNNYSSSKDVILEIHQTMRKNKAWIDELLGLNASNMWRVTIPLTVDDSDISNRYPQTDRLLSWLMKVNGTSDYSLAKGYVDTKDGSMKLTRYLKKYLYKFIALSDVHLTSYIMSLGELNLVPVDQNLVLDNFRDPSTWKLDTYLCALGELRHSGVQAVISTNLYDFITASENASFTSCFRVGRDYFAGTVGYSRDSVTIITMIVKRDAPMTNFELYKVGRSWAYLIPETQNGQGPYIIQPRRYGSYSKTDSKQVRAFIQKRWATSLDVPNTWIKTSVDDNTFWETSPELGGYPWAGYFDPKYSATSVCWLSGHVRPTRVRVPLVHAQCLACGREHSCGSGFCEDCQSSYECDRCGYQFSPHEMHVYHDELYCSDCFGMITTLCVSCNARIYREHADWVGDYPYCESCFNDEFRICLECERAFKFDDLRDIEGYGWVCSDCFEDHFVVCTHCDRDVHKDDAFNAEGDESMPICRNCSDQYFTKCSDCQDWYETEHLINGVCERCTLEQKGILWGV